MRDAEMVSDPDKQRGLSLLELLLAVFLMGMLATIVYSAFATMTAAWNRTIVSQERWERRRILQTFLSDLMAGSLPVLEEHAGRRRVVFSGSRHTLEFVAPVKRIHAVPGLYRVRLDFDRGDSSAIDLYFTYCLWRSTLKCGAGFGGKRLLIGNLERGEFSYWDRNANAWVSTWRNRSDVPDEVRIQLSGPAWQGSTWSLAIHALGAVDSSGR